MRETVLYQLAVSQCDGVRRDRGEALYVARSVSEECAFRVAQRKNGLFALYMTEKCISVLDSALFPFPEDALYQSLLRRKGQCVTDGEMRLLTRFVKLYETRDTFPAEAEKELRQCCALCLREKTGGGALYLARALMLMGGIAK